jgi:hypothetical protein
MYITDDDFKVAYILDKNVLFCQGRGVGEKLRDLSPPSRIGSHPARTDVTVNLLAEGLWFLPKYIV